MFKYNTSCITVIVVITLRDLDDLVTISLSPPYKHFLNLFKLFFATISMYLLYECEPCVQDDSRVSNVTRDGDVVSVYAQV